MRHTVHRSGNRLLVVHLVPGTNVGGVVSDYPLAASGAARVEAARLSEEPSPEVSPEERRVPPGFYDDQGALF